MKKISNSLTSSLKHLGLSVHICHTQEKNQDIPQMASYILTVVLAGRCK